MSISISNLILSIAAIVCAAPVLRMIMHRLKLEPVPDQVFIRHPRLIQSGMSVPDVRRIRHSVEASIGAAGKLHPDMTIDHLAALEMVGDWIDDLEKQFGFVLGDENCWEACGTVADLMIELWRAESRIENRDPLGG